MGRAEDISEALDLIDERRRRGFPLIRALLRAIRNLRKKRRARRRR
jgi:hypothetical protein